jgi:hypothetical protein
MTMILNKKGGNKLLGFFKEVGGQLFIVGKGIDKEEKPLYTFSLLLKNKRLRELGKVRF